MKFVAAFFLSLVGSFAHAGPVLSANLRLFNPNADFKSTVELEERGKNYIEYLVKYPSAVRSPFPANNTVWGHLYLPARGYEPESLSKPCILLLPVMAAPNLWIETRFIHSFVEKGYAVFLVEMPYQFHRIPAPLEPSGQVFLARTPEHLTENFSQSVDDARRAISWLKRSGKVDPDRIGIFGISLGALVGSVVFSIDDRLRGAIFLLGGANLANLLFHSSETRSVIEKLGYSEDDLRGYFRGLDALDYKDTNRDKRVLLLNAWSDAVVPRSNARALKTAFPGARQIWLPFGHYSGMIHLIWVPTYIAWKFHDFL